MSIIFVDVDCRFFSIFLVDFDFDFDVGFFNNRDFDFDYFFAICYINARCQNAINKCVTLDYGMLSFRAVALNADETKKLKKLCLLKYLFVRRDLH